MSQHADLIIHARWIVPVVPANVVHQYYALVIRGADIIALAPSGDVESLFSADQVLHLDDHVVIPGLVNAHGHSPMTLLRGIADDLPLQTWLENHIWPVEGRWISEHFVRDGAELAMAEMIRAGTTCFADMYFFPETIAATALEAGMRCQLASPVMKFPSAWGSGPDEYISKALALMDDFRSHDLIHIAFGPHAPYTVDDAELSRIATLAEELDAGIHIHLHETASEIDSAAAAGLGRPIQRLADLGVLGPQTQCVHMTQIVESDIELLQNCGAHVIHCPESNLKLASGACPAARLLDAGINVALGTDGAASNNDLDMFGEMRSAALLAKLQSGDAASLNAHQCLRMATFNGAKALGLANRCGSLEPGKAADICAIDLNAPEIQPVFHPVSNLLYTSAASCVSHVWVNGRCLLADRQLQTISRHEVITKARRWATKIQSQQEESTPA